ncbi:MAG TPA: helix-turn-helix transcriptional regulator [Armatimonadota bacterium]|jgi:PadR family transcriptional regulator PadR
MSTDRELLKGNTPTLVLAVLRDGPLHGYAIAREIERRSGSSLRCKEGTLYPALHSLEHEGLISGEWSRQKSGRDRKVYSITPAGDAGLRERVQVWARFADAVHKVLEGDERHGREEQPPSIPVRGRLEPEAG